MTAPRVMRYHDGELSPAAARRVERELAENPGLAAELAAQQALRELLLDWAEARSRHHDDLVDDVMRAIEQRPYSRRAPRRRGARFLAWASLAVGVAAGTALALHALALPERSADDARLAPGAGPGAARSVAIESVDFGARGGTVFMVSTNVSDTPVVWTDDDPNEDEQRNEAL